MRVIHARRRQQSKAKRHWLPISLGLCLGVFLLVNGGMWAYYHSRAYPNSRMGSVNISSMRYAQILEQAKQQNILPAQLTIINTDKKVAIKTAEYGLKIDRKRTQDALDDGRVWLPVANLFKRHRVPAPVAIDLPIFTQKLDTLGGALYTPPINAKISLDDGFRVIAGRDGTAVDKARLDNVILAALDRGKSTVEAPTTPIRPDFTTKEAEAEAGKLQAQLGISLVFKYQAKTTQPGNADIAKWYVPAGNSFVINDTALRIGLAEQGKKLGVRPQNLTQAVAEVKAALAQNKPLQFSFTPFATTRTYSYCTNVKDVAIGNLQELKPRVAATLNDIRGWSLDGQVEYREVSSGCDFTVWLSAASQMPSFGAICDSMWSCRVGSNVVINFDRWQNASPAWRQYGGSLEDYRHMVINHETGHWLGFGHDHCSGPGQPAPVMQQQSISLQGCIFSPWPNQAELATLRSRIGL